MRKWSLLALAVVLAGALGGYFGFGRTADVQAQDCDDWVQETNDRVNDARTLLYPADRPDAFQGSADEAAREMDAILAEQEESEPPDGGGNLNGDLIEAMLNGFEALSGGGSDPAVQITFAKSILYNADARLVALNDSC